MHAELACPSTHSKHSCTSQENSLACQPEMPLGISSPQATPQNSKVEAWHMTLPSSSIRISLAMVFYLSGFFTPERSHILPSSKDKALPVSQHCSTHSSLVMTVASSEIKSSKRLPCHAPHLPRNQKNHSCSLPKASTQFSTLQSGMLLLNALQISSDCYLYKIRKT